MEKNSHLFIAAAVVIGAVIIAVGNSLSSGFAPAGKIGSVQAVTLVGGQVYFGKLADVTQSTVVLTDLVEAQTVTNPQTNQRSVQLLRRSTGAWHQPRDMSIPKDKILFAETVGPGSQVNKSVVEAPAPAIPPAN